MSSDETAVERPKRAAWDILDKKRKEVAEKYGIDDSEGFDLESHMALREKNFELQVAVKNFINLTLIPPVIEEIFSCFSELLQDNHSILFMEDEKALGEYPEGEKLTNHIVSMRKIRDIKLCMKYLLEQEYFKGQLDEDWSFDTEEKRSGRAFKVFEYIVEPIIALENMKDVGPQYEIIDLFIGKVHEVKCEHVTLANELEHWEKMNEIKAGVEETRLEQEKLRQEMALPGYKRLQLKAVRLAEQVREKVRRMQA